MGNFIQIGPIYLFNNNDCSIIFKDILKTEGIIKFEIFYKSMLVTVWKQDGRNGQRQWVPWFNSLGDLLAKLSSVAEGMPRTQRTESKASLSLLPHYPKHWI